MTKQKKNNRQNRVEPATSDSLQRLQRVMAAAGIGSRRECETIIEEGRVEIDGKVVAELGIKVDPNKQEIFVDGERLVPERLQYFMLNKPPGIVSTSRDPSGRTRVIDLIKTDKRVYNVGRLDQSSEGLILVTNDGELANRLTHPRYGVEKKYHVQVAGVPAPTDLKKLEKGVYLAEGKAKASKVRFLRRVKNHSWIEIVLAEGRNREIRRMLASIGHKVRTLKRVAIGPLRMRDLPVGAHRPLTSQELKTLKRAATGQPPARPKKAAKKKKKAKAGQKDSQRSGSAKRSGSKSATSDKRPTAGRKKPANKKKPGGRAAGSRKKIAAKNAAKRSNRKPTGSKKPKRR